MAWEVKRSLIGSYLVETGRDQGPIHFWNKENAELFAAADDLLKVAAIADEEHQYACSDCQHGTAQQWQACKRRQQIEAAIAKAKGKQA